MNGDIAIIEPKRGRHEDPLPETGVIAFTSQDLELLVGGCCVPPRRTHRLYLADVYSGSYAGLNLALVGPSLGAPQTILILEKLIALGVRNVIALGWCGSLQAHVAIGDVVVPTGAISEEGTSRHYPLTVKRPGPASELVLLARRSLREHPLAVHEGYVWSTDAPYRETVDKVLKYQKEGILAVEMEVAALLAVAHFRGIRLAPVLVVSDELHTLKWVHGFRESRFKQSRERLAKVVLETVKQIHQPPS